MGLAFTAPLPAPKPVKSARVVGDVLGPLPPARRPGGVRRAGAHGAGLRAALSADRRPGQLRLARRRRRGGDALHRSAPRADRAAAARRDRRRHGRLHPQLRRLDRGAAPVAGAPAVRAASTARAASPSAWRTEIPSHNLREVAAAAIALLKRRQARPTTSSPRCCPAPTIRAAARSSAAPDDIRAAYATGRGSLKVRARWKIEDLARGQWQLVVTELPPGTSAQKVLEEIEELTNPKVKRRQEGAQRRAAAAEGQRARGARRGARRVEQGRARCASCSSRRPAASSSRPTWSPRCSPHTSLESSTPINLTMVGSRRPADAEEPARRCSASGSASATQTVERRSRHRLGKVADRIHILEGRQLVLLHIDEVIRDHPRRRRAEAGADRALHAERAPGRRHPRHPSAPAGAARGDQDRAGAEGAARRGRAKLNEILASPAALQAHRDPRDRGRCQGSIGDERRTLIEAAEAAPSPRCSVVDEPVTVVVSMKGWVRALKGHEVECRPRSPSRPAMRCTASFACRTRRHAARLRQQRPRLLAWRWHSCRAGAATASRSPR
mgnify:CR=1 FL=1